MAVRRMAQTQTESYWRRDFKVRPEDIEAIYDLMLEDGRPRTLDELTCAVMSWRVRREAQTQRPEDAVLYRPREHFAVGQHVYFPHLEMAVGTVVAERPGRNPRYGEFTVIGVQFEGESQVREFAADYTLPHPLNDLSEEVLTGEETELSPEELCACYGEPVREALREALPQNPEFIVYDDQWFLRGLLPEVHVGHLNLAEAVIDVAGRPLSPQEIGQQVDLDGEVRPRAAAFALNLSLAKDGRFDNVGTEANPRWFLYNLEPVGVASKPTLLEADWRATGNEWLQRESLEIAQEIGDEFDELAADSAAVAAVLESGKASFVLNYPHRREGTLPLTHAIRAMFPTQEYSRIPVTFVESTSDKRWMGWILPAEGYGWGLGDWYNEQGVPVGATVELLLTREPNTVAVQCDTRSRRTEWAKVPGVENARLVFEIRKRAYMCRYDRNLLIGEPTDTARLDELHRQQHSEAEPRSIVDIILAVFPELAKLGSQGLVHAKTLYAAVNVVWRTGAVPLFAELARNACFDPVGDGNWVLDDSLIGVVYDTPEDMETRPRSQRADLIRDRVVRYGSPA